MEYLDLNFGNLPEALVEEMLARSEDIGSVLTETLKALQDKKNLYHQQLIQAELLKREAELPHIPPPTTCAIDACFELECRAMKKVRDEMGLSNVQLMIPFVRTVEQGQQVIQL
ncbi:MAG: hypothetical protein SVR94_04705, partial [Pseudomonadota bacterium]|nr:hypothetical protein [Pseudomonadota bacterium]